MNSFDHWITGVVFAGIGLAFAGQAGAQIVLNDPLQGSTTGTRDGGTFVAGGWRVDNEYNSIYWHVPTLSHGAFEFDVVGLPDQNCPGGAGFKNELSHMYDYTFNNADNVYGGAYQSDPYKQFLRKQCDPGKVNTMEILWQIIPTNSSNFREDDTGALSWNVSTPYHFRCEWQNAGGNATMKTYRNNVLIMDQTLPGSWSPAGQSVRIAASPRRADEGATVGSIYSNVKVTDLDVPLTEVSIDMGCVDSINGLTNLQPGDGNTTCTTIGGRDCRRNVNPSVDGYMYFGIYDAFAYQGSKPDVYIFMDYYDTGTTTLSLNYDSNTGDTLSAMYKYGGGVTLTNTNTWKTKSFHVTDAYFGNRENAGADFRIEDITNTFYLDTLRVTTQAPVPPIIAPPAPPCPRIGYGGIPFTMQFSLTQGDPAPAWSVTQGPAGATINAGGLVSWTPPAGVFADYIICVQATNSEGLDSTCCVVRVVSRVDFDADSDVDQSDFSHFQNCFSGDGHAHDSGCANADLDDDGDVDPADFAAFLPCLAGADHVPGC